VTLWRADSIPAEALVFDDGEVGDGPDGCAVGMGLADARFIGVGDRLPLMGADGRIVAPRVRGVFSAESSILTNDLVVMPTSQLRRLFTMDAAVATDLFFNDTATTEIYTVAGKIQAMWPDVRTISRPQILRTYDAVFDWRGGVWVALLLSSIAAFSILVWDKGTGLSAEEYRTLGVLKAVGWRTRDVLELKLWEGVITSGTAVLLGLIAAQVHVLWFDGALFSRVLRGWSVLFPAFDLRPNLDLRTLLLLLVLAVLPYVVASLVPSWRAAITDPDSIIRS
jgi:ABC-type lipoprotein release transport system permease subunit